MSKDEVDQLVAKLDRERRERLQSIEAITIKDIKDKFKKNYVPRMKTKDELMREVKVKKSWKGSGNSNDYFSIPPIMKPKMLDEWTASRTQAPDRSFKKLFISGLKPFANTYSKGKEIGHHPYPTVVDDYLKVPKKKDKKSTLPLCMERETKFMSFKRTGDRFGFSTHTTWETFQRSLTEFKVPGQEVLRSKRRSIQI
mmetsp:Transcript_13898/g.16111  ORF Transcript_13898/g.16111 Transcript_13898/m.16111 type:complete len:198 (-) Transcript_13898:94-687(-)